MRLLIPRVHGVVAALLIALPCSLPAQIASEGTYRQTVLTIQRSIESGDLIGARKQLSAARLRFPKDGGLDNLQGVVAVQLGDMAQAREAFGQAIQHNPKLVAGYLNLARLALQTSHSSSSADTEALQLYKRVLILDPANDEANIDSAELLLAAGDATAAGERLHAASLTAGRSVRSQAVLCGVDAALGRQEQTDALAATLASDAALSEADVLAAVPGLRIGRRADVLQSLLVAASSRQPLNGKGLHLLGLAQEAQGDLQSARATLERAYALEPASVNILTDLSRIAISQKQDQDALGYLAHARAIAPQDAALAFQFGSVCFQMNLLGEAQKAIGEALSLAPDNPHYVLAMAKVTLLSQDPLKASTYLDQYRRMEPSDPEGTLLTGAMYFRAKDFASAIHWLSSAKLSGSTQGSANLYLGSIARQQGKLEDALASLNAAAGTQPKDAQTHAELGQTYLQLKQYKEAEAEFDRSIALDANNYAANFGLVQLYAHNDDPRRASQAVRFEEIKRMQDQDTQQAMRTLEVRPDAGLPSTP